LFSKLNLGEEMIGPFEKFSTSRRARGRQGHKESSCQMEWAQSVFPGSLEKQCSRCTKVKPIVN